MRIRDFVRSFRARRARRLTRTDSVSFEAFCNESPSEKLPQTKESSLNGDIAFSPVKLNNTVYPRVQRRPEPQTARPSLVTILLIIVLSAVFLILPIVYLLNCFDVIYEHNALKHNPIIKSSDYYEPSDQARDLLEVTTDNKSSVNTVKKELPQPPSPNYNQCKLLQDYEKFDCFPESGSNKEQCESRGCCWIPAKTKPKNNDGISTPYCFYPPDFNTYKYINVSQTAFGLVAFLKRSYRTAYPNDVEVLKMIVKYETDTRLHVKFVDAVNQRYEPPFPEVPVADMAAQNLKYIFEMDLFKPGFKVVRKSDNTTLFDSNNFLNFIFSDQFLQFSAKLPSKYIYGIGEHQSNLMLSTEYTRFTLFNHDQPPTFNANLYGSHPFYMVMENTSNSHGVFLLNSNAMDIILQPSPAITFRPIGGVLDFYFFLGPTPSDVIIQYTDLIGKPHMPPYWALGFHLCRYGYKTLNNTRNVMQRNIDAGIPLDTQWNDLDYMNQNNDFTYDKNNFDGLPDFIKELHSKGMHYIPLIDPGISASEPKGTYPPYDKGIEFDIFVKNSSNQPFIGKVWNAKSTVWPDFTNPKTVDYWTLMLRNMHDEFNFDGAWIDMNEPSNFLDGTIDGCQKSSLEAPPYLPAVWGGKLSYKTMCMNAQHFVGIHYDVHNLYGFAEAMATSFAMAEIRGKRPVVISRSTFPGHGKYAGHWSGDVFSQWSDLKYSVPQLLTFSMFGIPLMGADICGFNGNTTQSLCNRWHQLGAFYPFSRNHNTDDGIDQDPVAMGDIVVQSTKKALNLRYSLLPYLYTLFYKAYTVGETVARPLFFEFSSDLTTYSIDAQFLWGPALMIVPVLEDNASDVEGYFPQGTWYDIYTKSGFSSKGQFMKLSAPFDLIPVLIRGGYVLPCQGVKQTTTESRKTKFEVMVASDSNGEAYGELYYDDGDSLNSYTEKAYILIAFELSNNILKTNILQYNDNINIPNLGSITVLGVQKPVTEVIVNNLTPPFKFDTVHKYLVIDELNLTLERSFVVSWK